MVNYGQANAGVVPMTVQFPLWHSSVNLCVHCGKDFRAHHKSRAIALKPEAIRRPDRSLHREHLRPSFLNGTNSCAAETAQIQQAIRASQRSAKLHLSAAAHRDNGTLFSPYDLGSPLDSSNLYNSTRRNPVNRQEENS